MKMGWLAAMDVVRRYASVFRESWGARRSFDPVHWRQDELAFQPAIVELMDRPVSPASSVVIRVLLALVTSCLVWAAFGKLDVVANAQGKIVADTRTKTIEALETAVVRRVLTRDGDKVSKGQVLVELDAVGVGPDVNQSEDALQRARLNAERARATLASLDDGTLPRLSPLPGIPVSRMADAERLAASQIDALRQKTASLKAAVAEKEAERRTAAGSVGALREYAKISAERVDEYKRLLGTNYVSRQDYLMREQERISALRDMKTQEDRVVELTSAIEVSRHDLATTMSDSRRQLMDSEREAREAINQLEPQVDKAEQRGASMVLRSPVNGTVQALSAHTVGGVVQQAQPILSVVPDDDAVEVEATILNQDIGFVHPGQAVVAKVQSFPYTRYGYLDAQVMSVSHDAVSDPKLGLVFPAQIRLKRSTMAIDGTVVRLSPGMALDLEIKTGKRTVLDYVLDPLRVNLHEGLGER